MTLNNDAAVTPAETDTTTAPVAAPPVEVELTDADLKLDDDPELQAVLEEAAATIKQASEDTVAASASQEPPKPQPKPMTVSQEAAVAAFGGLTDMLGRYDMIRTAVERISGEMRDLRIALDAFEPTQLIETTVAGIRIPMTANAVLEAKRVELARAMDYMRELAIMTTERSEAMAEASYLDMQAERAGTLAPPRRNPTRSPVIRERAPDAPMPRADGLNDALEQDITALVQQEITPPASQPRREEDPVPPFLTKGPRHYDEPAEQPGLLKRMTSKLTGRNSG